MKKEEYERIKKLLSEISDLKKKIDKAKTGFQSLNADSFEYFKDHSKLHGDQYARYHGQGEQDKEKLNYKKALDIKQAYDLFSMDDVKKLMRETLEKLEHELKIRETELTAIGYELTSPPKPPIQEPQVEKPARKRGLFGKLEEWL